MKRLLPILLLLCACHRDPGRSGGSLPGVSTQQSPSGHGKLIMLIGGQSNTDAVYVNGIDNYYTAIRNHVVLDTSRIQTIHCAHGGSSASDWIPGKPLYDECLAEIKNFQNKNPDSRLWSITWVQGENEAQNCTDWIGNFSTMISDLRTQTKSPDVAIVWERINSAFDPPIPPDHAGAPCLAQVRQEQESLIPNGKYIDTDGIPLGPDNVHYRGTPESAGELGRRFGETLGTLLADSL